MLPRSAGVLTVVQSQVRHGAPIACGGTAAIGRKAANELPVQMSDYRPVQSKCNRPTWVGSRRRPDQCHCLLSHFHPRELTGNFRPKCDMTYTSITDRLRHVQKSCIFFWRAVGAPADGGPLRRLRGVPPDGVGFGRLGGFCVRICNIRAVFPAWRSAMRATASCVRSGMC